MRADREEPTLRGSTCQTDREQAAAYFKAHTLGIEDLTIHSRQPLFAFPFPHGCLLARLLARSLTGRSFRVTSAEING